MPYGVALALIFVVPVGIIKAMTGIEVTLNVLAEFIGGIWVQGNAVCLLASNHEQNPCSKSGTDCLFHSSP